MFEKIIGGLVWFRDTYIATYEGIATIITICIMLLKTLINQKASSLRFKKMIISIPGEIVVLVMGFLLSDIVSINLTENSAHRNISSTVANIIIALILLIFVYSLERYMDDKLSGKLGKAKVVLILFMYMFAIGFYVTILYGGVYSG